jgi:hypothetical protein
MTNLGIVRAWLWQPVAHWPVLVNFTRAVSVSASFCERANPGVQLTLLLTSLPDPQVGRYRVSRAVEIVAVFRSWAECRNPLSVVHADRCSAFESFEHFHFDSITCGKDSSPMEANSLFMLV